MWGLKIRNEIYSDKAFNLFSSLIDEQRKLFRQEFSKNVENRNGMHFGTRFYDDKKLFWALQSNVTEQEFLSEPKHYLFKILMGASEVDYYYTYEKDWGE